MADENCHGRHVYNPSHQNHTLDWNHPLLPPSPYLPTLRLASPEPRLPFPEILHVKVTTLFNNLCSTLFSCLVAFFCFRVFFFGLINLQGDESVVFSVSALLHCFDLLSLGCLLYTLRARSWPPFFNMEEVAPDNDATS